VKVEEMRALSAEELLKTLEAAHEDLFNLRFRLATRQLINHCELSRAKREIARVNTVLKEKELGIR
jgi:large subunit ribosomal protein L29